VVGKMPLAFVDCETLGLLDHHDLFELAVIRYEPGGAFDEHVFWIASDDLELVHADPTALRINRYYERRHATDARKAPSEVLAVEIAQLLSGVVLAGVCVDFDARKIRKFLNRHGHQLASYHHLLDVEVFAAGKLGCGFPVDSRTLSDAFKVAYPPNAHEALADARWARDLYVAAGGPLP